MKLVIEMRQRTMDLDLDKLNIMNCKSGLEIRPFFTQGVLYKTNLNVVTFTHKHVNASLLMDYAINRQDTLIVVHINPKFVFTTALCKAIEMSKNHFLFIKPKSLRIPITCGKIFDYDDVQYDIVVGG